jgi:hypothetical protein
MLGKMHRHIKTGPLPWMSLAERRKMNAYVSSQDHTAGSSYHRGGGDTIDAAKEKLRVWLENDDNLRSLDWVSHSNGSAPEIVVMMEISPAKDGEDGEGV